MSGASKRKNADDSLEPETEQCSSKKLKKMPKAHHNPPTELRHINFDCLVKIFESFSKLDLMNVIVYDMALMDAARYVFEKKFAKETFQISNKPLFDVNGKSRIVQYLRAFGCVMESLYMIYHNKYREFDRLIEMAIIQNCTNSLLKLKFRNAKSHSMKNITEPFDRIQEVAFTGSEFGEMISNFSRWFPNAYSLKLNKQMPQPYEYRRRLEKYHPALTHFTIKDNPVKQRQINANSAWKKLDNYNLITFLKCNPQLQMINLKEYGMDSKRFKLDHFGIEFNYELLTTIHQELKNLHELYLTYYDRSHINFALPDIIFKRLEKFEVEFISATVLKYFPLEFDKLNHLSLKTASAGSECLNYIRKNRNVKKLSVEGRWKKMRYFFDFNHLVAKMPNLMEICVIYQSEFHASNYVVELLAKCKKLDKLTIIGAKPIRAQRVFILSEEQLEHVAGLVGPGWKTTVCSHAKYDCYDCFALIIERLYELVELD